MTQKHACYCGALILVLVSASAALERLNFISELTNRYQNQDTNVWELLHWFASTVTISRGNRIQLNFNPNYDYGSHHYGNHEDLLSSPPWRHKYYTVGNIHQETLTSLPNDVVNARRGSTGWNRARIIFSATTDGEINRIFITEHQGQYYSPDRTYEVSASLLQEFRRRNRNEIRHFAEQSRRGNVGGVFLQSAGSSDQHYYTPQAKRRTNDGNVCSVICIAVFIICVIAVVVFLGNMKK